MRVLFIADNYPNNIQPESGLFIHQQALALHRHGVQVRVIAPVPWVPTNGSFRGWPPYKQVHSVDEVNDIPVYHPRYLTPPRPIRVDYWWLSMPLVLKNMLARIRQDFPFDLIHGQNLFYEGSATIQLARRFRLPAVVSSRGSDAAYWPYHLPRYKTAVQSVVKTADQIVTVSQAQRQLVEDLASPRNDIHVIYNGIDAARFLPQPEVRFRLRERLGILPNEIVLIYVGALAENKGVAELLAAFEVLAVNWPQLRLILIGGGASSDYWKQKARELASFNHIHFGGSIPHDTVPEWLNASDIFVFPSYREGLPNAVLEAAAVGLPIVTTDCGGIPEIIQHEKNGLLVPPRDEIALIAALKRMIVQPELRTGLGKRARVDILNTFSWDEHGKKLYAIYDTTLKRNK